MKNKQKNNNSILLTKHEYRIEGILARADIGTCKVRTKIRIFFFVFSQGLVNKRSITKLKSHDHDDHSLKRHCNFNSIDDCH